MREYRRQIQSATLCLFAQVRHLIFPRCQGSDPSLTFAEKGIGEMLMQRCDPKDSEDMP